LQGIHVALCKQLAFLSSAVSMMETVTALQKIQIVVVYTYESMYAQQDIRLLYEAVNMFFFLFKKQCLPDDLHQDTI
jgi:hypothetical protein